MSADIDQIEGGRLYNLREAAALIPSVIPGKSMHVETLRLYLKRGVIKGVRRPSGRHQQWFVFGEALRNFLGAAQRPVPEVVTAAELKRRDEAARAELRKRGIKC